MAHAPVVTIRGALGFLPVQLMAATPIDDYRRQIERELHAGNATEHAYRPASKTLVDSLAAGVTDTNQPKHVEGRAPDFVVTRKAPHGPLRLGEIEAKDMGEDLDEIERSDQIKRYLALPNLFLTGHLEFRWYVDGEHRQIARLARIRVRTSGETSHTKGFCHKYKRGRCCFERN